MEFADVGKGVAAFKDFLGKSILNAIENYSQEIRSGRIVCTTVLSAVSTYLPSQKKSALRAPKFVR